MKEDKQVAKNYAQALHEIAKGDLILEETFPGELKIIIESIFKNNQDMFFKNPGISKKEKNDLLKKLFEGKINEKILNLLFLLIDKQRFSLLPDIQNYLNKSVNKTKGIVIAEVFSPQKLDSNTLENIRQRLENTLGGKEKVTIESKIEPALIGGIKVRVNDLIYDGSVRNRLDNLKRSLGG